MEQTVNKPIESEQSTTKSEIKTFTQDQVNEFTDEHRARGYKSGIKEYSKITGISDIEEFKSKWSSIDNDIKTRDTRINELESKLKEYETKEQKSAFTTKSLEICNKLGGNSDKIEKILQWSGLNDYTVSDDIISDTLTAFFKENPEFVKDQNKMNRSNKSSSNDVSDSDNEDDDAGMMLKSMYSKTKPFGKEPSYKYTNTDDAAAEEYLRKQYKRK